MRTAVTRFLLTISLVICASDSLLGQDIKSAKLVEGSQPSDMTFGPTALARPFTTREAAKWGFDFIASPSRAIDRRLFYAYKISRLTAGTIDSLLAYDANNRDSRRDYLVAFVNVPESGPLSGLGGDKVYYGTPYFASPSTVATQEMRQQFSRNAGEIAPRIVAVAALKSAGIAVAGLSEGPLRPKDVNSYIAVTTPLPNTVPDMYFIMAESSWHRVGLGTSLNWGFKFAE